MGFSYRTHIPVVSVLGTSINYDDDDDDDDNNNSAKTKQNKKKTIGSMRKRIALHDAF